MIIKLDAEMLTDGLGAANKWRDEGLIDFLDKGMLLRVTDPGDSGVYSMLIPSDSMEEYDPRGMETLGIKYDALLDFMHHNDGMISLEAYEDDNQLLKIELTNGSRKYTVGSIDEEYIEGNPDRVPQIDHAFSAKMDWDVISSFFDDFYKIVGDGGGVHMSVMGGMMYLWGRYDDNQVYDEIHLEDLGDLELDYGKAFENESVDLNPREDERLDNLISVDLIRSLNVNTDDVRLEFENYAPIKIVSEHENGLKQSWIITPRIPTQDTHTQIPESVINRRNVLE